MNIGTLANSVWPHPHVINIDDAERIGLQINKTPAKLAHLKVYKKWVQKRLSAERSTHVIEYFCPKERPKVLNISEALKSNGKENEEKIQAI